MPPNLSSTRELHFKEPFDWAGLLAFFQVRAVPGVELVTDTSYSRSIRHQGRRDIITISPHARASRLTVKMHFSKEEPGPSTIRKVRNLFDLDANPKSIATTLKDPVQLSKALPELNTLRVPGAWDLFEIGVRAILGQQVTVAGARTLAERLVKRFGTQLPNDTGLSGQWFDFPDAEKLAVAPVEVIGMPAKRAEAIRRFAALMANYDGQIPDQSEFAVQLLEIPGIGPWTVNYIMMRGLKDPDAFPEGDVALLKAARSLSLADSMKELKQVSEQWRPLRAYATIALWKVLSNQKKH